MSFTRILDSDFNGHGARSLDDVPQISALALKTEFDYPARDIVAPSVNRLITELENRGADSIGIDAPDGRTGNTVEEVIDSISDGLSAVEEIIGSGALHTHDNLPLLQTYTNTNADITEAVEMKHEHDNKSVLDKFGESGSVPTFDGDPIGMVQTAFTKVKVGETEIDANNTSDFIEFVSGENVRISASEDAKSITISSTGGGGGGGSVTVIDNHTSTDTNAALSANQGRVIWDAKADKTNVYTKSEIDTSLASKVPTSRTVNGKALSSDISLTYTDVNALSSSTTHVIGDILNPSTKSSGDYLKYNGTDWVSHNPMDDTQRSETDTWTSNKIGTELDAKADSTDIDYWFGETKYCFTGATSVSFAVTDWTKGYMLFAETADNSPVKITNYTKLANGDLQYSFSAISSTQSGTDGVKFKLRVIV